MAEKAKKDDRRRAKYSAVVCAKWALKKVWQWDRRLVFVALAMIPVGVVMYLLDLYSTSWILASLETADVFGTIALTVAATMTAQMLFRIIRSMLSNADRLMGHTNSERLWHELNERGYLDDYQLRLDPAYRRLKDGAFELLGRGANSPGNYLIGFATMAINVICFVFFSSVIAMLHPAIIVLLVGGSLIIFFLQRRENRKNFELRDERNAADRKTNYITWYLSNDPAIGKDVCLYDMPDYLDKKAAITLLDIIRFIKMRQHNANVCYAVIFTIAALRDGIAYWFLIQGALSGTIDASMFVLYFSAIMQMANFISDMINYFAGLHDQKLALSDAIEYMEEDHNLFNHGKGIPLPDKKAVSIEFKNVTYRYPDGGSVVFSHTFVTGMSIVGSLPVFTAKKPHAGSGNAELTTHCAVSPLARLPPYTSIDSVVEVLKPWFLLIRPLVATLVSGASVQSVSLLPLRERYTVLPPDVKLAGRFMLPSKPVVSVTVAWKRWVAALQFSVIGLAVASALYVYNTLGISPKDFSAFTNVL